MILAHGDRLRTALEQIADIAGVTIARPRKNEALLVILNIAENALKL